MKGGTLGRPCGAESELKQYEATAEDAHTDGARAQTWQYLALWRQKTSEQP